MGIKSYFHSVLTVGIICIVFFSSFLSSFSNSIQEIQEKQPNWQEIISTFYELNKQDRSNSIAQIRNDITEAFSDTSSYFLLKPFIDSDVNSVVHLADQWLRELEIFRDYRFSVDGVINVRSPQQFFTTDLADFLTRTQPLFVETQREWQNLWMYRSLASFSGKQKLITTFSIIDQILKIVEYIYNHSNSILDILGYKTVQRIVLFNQNTAEARLTGGFIGSYIPFEIDKGQIAIGQSNSIYWIQGSQKKPRITSPFVSNYAIPWGQQYNFGGASDTNNFSCFPTSAAFLQREFADSTTGFPIDHLAMITPEVLNEILPPDFEFKVAGVGTLSSSQLLSEIDRLTALEYDNPQNPKEVLTPIFDALLNRLPDILSYHGTQGILSIVANLAFTRDVQLWSNNEQTQTLFSYLDITGEKTCESSSQNSDKIILSPLLFNTSGDKRNGITSNSWSISSRSVIGGQRVSVTYQQVIEDPENIPRGVFNKDLSFTFAGLQIPKNAQNLDVYSPQALRRTFKPNFYIQNIQERQSEFESPAENQLLWDSGVDLSEGANPPGFRYDQPDGSRVLGIYINDDMVSSVTFEFTLPVSTPQTLFFVPQVGFRKPLLSLGDGIDFVSYPNQKIMNNRTLIMGGVNLLLVP